MVRDREKGEMMGSMVREYEYEDEFVSMKEQQQFMILVRKEQGKQQWFVIMVVMYVEEGSYEQKKQSRDQAERDRGRV